jgi:hypothetical protein
MSSLQERLTALQEQASTAALFLQPPAQAIFAALHQMLNELPAIGQDQRHAEPESQKGVS